MAEKTLNTRIKLRYASYSEWQSSTVQLLQGEVALCYVESNNSEIKNTAPTVLFKVGDGVHTFKDLKWASARAADVHDWAKEENLQIEKAGTGNVVASISWDTTNKKFVYQTASVATSQGLADLQATVSQLSSDLTDARTRLATAEGKISTLETNVAKKVEQSVYNEDKTRLEGLIEDNAEAIGVINGEGAGSIKHAVNAEKELRVAADNALDQKIAANTQKVNDEITRAKAAEEANTALINQNKTAIENNAKAIETNAKAIEALTNGASTEEIDSVMELVDYVNEHGTEVQGMKDRISAVEGYFVNGVAKNAQDADKLDGKDSSYFAVKTEVEGSLSTIASNLDTEKGRIDGLVTRIGEAEGDISALESSTSTLATNLEGVTGRVGTAEGKIAAIEEDYLKEEDKTQLSNLIVAEETRAKKAESDLAARVKTIEDDYLKAVDTLILDCGSYQ